MRRVLPSSSGSARRITVIGDGEATLGPGDTVFCCAELASSYATIGGVETIAHLTKTNDGDWVAS